MPKDTEYMKTVRDRFEAARNGWSRVREDFKDDLRFVCGDPSLQWDPVIKSNRDDDGIPALTMDRLNSLANSIVNQSKKDRPQPKVEPGDGGDPSVADLIEGKIRHILYISHASVAFDCAEAYCALGGLGYFKVIKDYTGKQSTNQEPRIRRVQDPMSEYPDPNVEEPDFSDAQWWFSRKKYRRDEYKAEFGQEPIPFPFPDTEAANMSDWGDETHVWVAEYYWVENVEHEFHVLADGRRGIAEDLAEQEPYLPDDVVSAKPLKERIIHCDIVDGEKPIEQNIWDGEYIPRIAVTGPERIYEGQRRFVSSIRYARDPQNFLNVTMSDTADRMATVNKAPFVGPKGAFKDRKWRDGKRHFYLEWDTVDSSGKPIEPGAVQRAQYDANIQSNSQAAMQAIDAIKGSMGYVDTVSRPSQADLSGVAVQRRDDQANMANMQFEDSLEQSMWHLGRVLIDLLTAMTDTPRVWHNRKEDGRQSMVPVTMTVPEGVNPYVGGYPPQEHVKIDKGDYGPVIEVGPSWATKQQEERQFLTQMVQGDPQLWMPYADLIFKKFGYTDMQERAELLLPPQIQQAMQSQKGSGPNPQMLAQQATQLQAQNQQLQALIQHVSQILQTKQVEAQGRIQVQNAKTSGDLAIERLKTIRALLENQQQHTHEATLAMTGHQVGAAQHMAQLMHDTELALQPPQPPAPAPAPAPEGQVVQ
jgi:Phage P22-like portal protein